MADEQVIEARLALMSDEERTHIKCYGPDAEQALILFNGSKKLGGIVSLNCDEMEAAGLLLEANDFFGYLNILDAPPREAFN